MILCELINACYDHYVLFSTIKLSSGLLEQLNQNGPQRYSIVMLLSTLCRLLMWNSIY